MEIVAVRDAESMPVDVEIDRPGVGDQEAHVLQVAAVEPCDLGNQVVEILLRPLVILARRSPAVIARHVDGVDLLKVGARSRSIKA